MTELIRVCKRCGRKYQGWNCPNDSCKKARQNRNAASAKSRANHSGSVGRRTKIYTSTLHWNSGASIGPINADACPPKSNPGQGKSFPDYESNPDW